ncbi:MAG: hypothetical protein WCL20_00600 [Actinomycetes bacterium]
MNRSKGTLKRQRELISALRRDPGHLPELVVLHAQRSLASGAAEWAVRAEGSESESATRAARAARTAARFDGMAAGTPFLLALVPGYIASLWEQVRLALRYAGMSGRDPASMQTAAELLVLRNVHPDVETAHKGLLAAEAGERESLGEGVRGHATAIWLLGRQILLLAAFMDASPVDRSRFRQIGSLLGAGAIWITTCILPLTFMLLMAWSCESATRKIELAARSAWLPELPPPVKQSAVQAVRRLVLLLLVTGVPVLFLARGVVSSSLSQMAIAAASGLAMALLLSLAVSRRT